MSSGELSIPEGSPESPLTDTEHEQVAALGEEAERLLGTATTGSPPPSADEMAFLDRMVDQSALTRIELRMYLRARILAMKAQGVPDQTIQRRLKLRPKRYQALLTAILRGTMSTEKVEEYRRASLLQLQTIQEALTPMALRGDATAASVVLRIVEETNKLVGAHAARKVKVEQTKEVSVVLRTIIDRQEELPAAEQVAQLTLDVAAVEAADDEQEAQNDRQDDGQSG